MSWTVVAAVADPFISGNTISRRVVLHGADDAECGDAGKPGG
jgi:hypothetical protein